MKKIYIYLLAATSIMGVSCSEDWLNLNPSTSVTTDQALSTSDLLTAQYLRSR
jgi:starch-binding outer membrane protein, SusD/RagB family